MDNFFKKEWTRNALEHAMPEKINDIIEIDYDEFKSKIESVDEEFIKKMISSLYKGNAYIVRNTFDKYFLEELKKKTLWELSPYEYEKNTPKDGIVDRLHIYRYPYGGGYLDTHSDPYKFQKTIIVVQMSKKGVEYSTGGLYFIDKNDKKVNLEDSLNVGDMYFTFPTVLHGVDAIDPDKNVNWDTIDGRWILGFYSMNSDHVENRHTVETKGSYK